MLKLFLSWGSVGTQVSARVGFKECVAATEPGPVAVKGALVREGSSYTVERLTRWNAEFIGSFQIKDPVSEARSLIPRSFLSFECEGRRFSVRPTAARGGCLLHAALGELNDSGIFQYPAQHPGDKEVGELSLEHALFLAKMSFCQKICKQILVESESSQVKFEDSPIDFCNPEVKKAYCDIISLSLMNFNANEEARCCGGSVDDEAVIAYYRSEKGKGLLHKWRAINEELTNGKISPEGHEKRCTELYLRLWVFFAYAAGCFKPTYFFDEPEIAMVALLYKLHIVTVHERDGQVRVKSTHGHAEDTTVFVYHDDRAMHFSAVKPVDVVASRVIAATPLASASGVTGGRLPIMLDSDTQHNDHHASAGAQEQPPAALLPCDLRQEEGAVVQQPRSNEESCSFIGLISSFLKCLSDRICQFFAFITCHCQTTVVE